MFDKLLKDFTLTKEFTLINNINIIKLLPKKQKKQIFLIVDLSSIMLSVTAVFDSVTPASFLGILQEYISKSWLDLKGADIKQSKLDLHIELFYQLNQQEPQKNNKVLWPVRK